MAWVITAAYEIELKSILIVVDHRNAQLNLLLNKISKQESWQNVHAMIFLNSSNSLPTLQN